MSSTVRVLTEDATLVTTTETAVNANLAAMVPPLPPLTTAEVIAGVIQVGMNALTKNYDEPNDAGFMPTLSIVGLPFSNVVVTIPAEQLTRIATVATALSVTSADVYNLALHAGIIVMNNLGPNKGYSPSFV